VGVVGSLGDSSASSSSSFASSGTLVSWASQPALGVGKALVPPAGRVKLWPELTVPALTTLAEPTAPLRALDALMGVLWLEGVWVREGRSKEGA